MVVSRRVLQHMQLGPQLLLQPVKAGLFQPHAACYTDGPFGCLNRNMKCRGWCCVSGYGTRRAHHTIPCPAWLPDNPYPIQAISSQLACGILYIQSTNTGQTVATHVSNPTVSLAKVGSECQQQSARSR